MSEMNPAVSATNPGHPLRLRPSPKEGLASVVIPVYRDASGLATTLLSLTRQSLPSTRFEVIVANDGADRAVSDICDRYSAKEVLIPENRGSYYARNRGLEQAAGEYIAFVDADITVPERWLEVGCSALGEADYVGGPVIVNEEEAKSPADYYEVLTGFRSNHPDSGHNFFVTANLFVTRRVFEEVGGFDERLRSGGDNEFGTRVFAAGRFSQGFREELAVLHPPRGYRKLVRKRVRIAYGKEILNRLHPERYSYGRLSTSRRILNILIPPNPGHARSFHARSRACSFTAWYLFLWRFKAELALRLLPIYSRVDREVRALSSGVPADPVSGSRDARSRVS
jgi:glycosyltransferase AglI